GQRSLADLRAIPWVFAWNQCRATLPAWYGFGSALETLRSGDPAAFEMLVRAKAEATRWAPWHTLVSNAATALMQADPGILRDYAELVPDAEVREALLGRILDEYERTRRGLEAIYGGPLAERRPEVHRLQARRAVALAPLHRQQITELARWRAARDAGQAEEAAKRLPGLLLTVHAIAAGLGSTG
ncbi:MAG: phosphoenolpyruvate carboxylase, partial [Myxococcota bacterium]